MRTGDARARSALSPADVGLARVAAATVSMRAVAAGLAGRLSYDDVAVRELGRIAAVVITGLTESELEISAGNTAERYFRCWVVFRPDAAGLVVQVSLDRPLSQVRYWREDAVLLLARLRHVLLGVGATVEYWRSR